MYQNFLYELYYDAWIHEHKVYSVVWHISTKPHLAYFKCYLVTMSNDKNV
jgi:hypothetical protein